ncbi:MAG: M14 family zinc carboxypeptidase [Acidobacteriota bacterium]
MVDSTSAGAAVKPPASSISKTLDVAAVLDGPATPTGDGRIALGRSRRGRPVLGYALGDGPRRVSLIGGCHADEPVGPAMLDRFVAWLQTRGAGHPALAAWSWCVVPHANPDGEVDNAPWTDALGPAEAWTREDPPVAVDLVPYLEGVVREKPGDDLEFGFPRGPGDLDARPEARAIADFLRPRAPFALHASFHGMAFAAGPWFLIEAAWIDRTAAMRDALRRAVSERGYAVHDIDRRGDKGFTRIDRGFTTRPDSRAMAAHFRALGDDDMAARFRPSSMETVRSMGGDPFTFVSEMPLFLLPADAFPADRPVHGAKTTALRRAVLDGPAAIRRAAAEIGVRPMPIRDQMEFQLLLLDAALDAVAEAVER